MARVDAAEVRRVACVGTGTIGSGWSAMFLARGFEVFAADPAPGAEARLALNVDDAWPKLESLGLSPSASRDRLRFTDDVDEAVHAAEFVQESATEDEDLKVELLARIDDACPPDTVIASSSSQYLPSRLAAGCRYPERVVIGHPFVPTYLIPLVELVGFERTDPDVLEWTMAFYRHLGKRPLRLKKEREGYNRQPAAARAVRGSGPARRGCGLRVGRYRGRGHLGTGISLGGARADASAPSRRGKGRGAPHDRALRLDRRFRRRGRAHRGSGATLRRHSDRRARELAR